MMGKNFACHARVTLQPQPLPYNRLPPENFLSLRIAKPTVAEVGWTGHGPFLARAPVPAMPLGVTV